MATKKKSNKPKSKYTSDKYKQGRISNDEIAFVKQNMNIMSEQEIADSLNRRIEKIQEIKGELIAREQGFIKNDTSVETIHDIKKRPEWPIFKKQFSPDELAFLVFRYSQLVAQFGAADVTATENIQLLQAIQLEIFMNRNAITTRQNQLMKEELELALQEIVDKAIKETDQQKKVELNGMKLDIQGKITVIMGGMRESTKQFTELHARIDQQMKALKGTRDQRLDKIQKSGKTMIGLLKYLDERENQESESRMAELVKLAVKKEENKLKELHTFVDGSVDSIFLFPEDLEEQDGV